ncbi:MAG: DUF2075 domain-containing protein [Gammaproteobacteria bacterium]|nr:DUF2075 domain-containing protein [Gammaproteobacteria bacterium]
MLVYTASRAEFSAQVQTNEIENRVLEQFKSALGQGTSASQIASWRNSLNAVNQALNVGEIPPDAQVAIEYQIPLTAKRVDLLVSGLDSQERENLVIVELKQWSDVRKTSKDAIVKTYLGGGIREEAHPSYQAWTYASLIKSFNVAVQQGPIGLHPCAYLHNCESQDALGDQFYQAHTEKAPVYVRQDIDKLAEFLGQRIRHGDAAKILQRVDQSPLKPSKELADTVASLLQGNEEFIMIDEQKLVFEEALALSRMDSDKKRVLLVEGGPGTGKSVIAINLLVKLINAGKVAHYVTNNNAPREIYEAKLAGSKTSGEISALFKKAGHFVNARRDSVDVLIVDEAHRLMERWFRDPKGRHHIKEMLNAAKQVLFFMDQDQIIHFKDIGDREELRQRSLEAGADVKELKLESQFRCNGSDSYLDWLSNTLQLQETDTSTLDVREFDFKVFDSPHELHETIISLNQSSNKSRMVAGYCWNWEGRKNPVEKDVKIPEHHFEKKWNLSSYGSTWLIEENSVDEIGCIHTCQGLELEYVGVIVGKDFVIRDGIVQTDANERAKSDDATKGYKKMFREDPADAKRRADRVIKNTYRTLMTRGQKGCFIYCVDSETQEYFKHCVGQRDG